VQDLGGSTARQLSQAGQWKNSIPWMSFSVYEWRLACGAGVCSSRFQEFESFLAWEFELLGGISWNLQFLGSIITARGLAVNWPPGDKKNRILYILFCIFIIIIILSSSSSSSYFLCCLIKLSLSQPTGFQFCPFFLPILMEGEGEG